MQTKTIFTIVAIVAAIGMLGMAAVAIPSVPQVYADANALKKCLQQLMVGTAGSIRVHTARKTGAIGR